MCVRAVAALKGSIKLSDLTHIVITHMDPKSIPTLELLLKTLGEEGGDKAKMILSNPALKLLQSSMGRWAICLFVCSFVFHSYTPA